MIMRSASLRSPDSFLSFFAISQSYNSLRVGPSTATNDGAADNFLLPACSFPPTIVTLPWPLFTIISAVWDPLTKEFESKISVFIGQSIIFDST
jgi:hypothetical protein